MLKSEGKIEYNSEYDERDDGNQSRRKKQTNKSKRKHKTIKQSYLWKNVHAALKLGLRCSEMRFGRYTRTYTHENLESHTPCCGRHYSQNLNMSGLNLKNCFSFFFFFNYGVDHNKYENFKIGNNRSYVQLWLWNNRAIMTNLESVTYICTWSMQISVTVTYICTWPISISVVYVWININ